MTQKITGEEPSDDLMTKKTTAWALKEFK